MMAIVKDSLLVGEGRREAQADELTEVVQCADQSKLPLVGLARYSPLKKIQSYYTLYDDPKFEIDIHSLIIQFFVNNDQFYSQHAPRSVW